MSSEVLFLIPFAAALAVWSDAERNVGAPRNVAFGWAAATFLFVIIALPLYLVWRPKAVGSFHQHPAGETSVSKPQPPAGWQGKSAKASWQPPSRTAILVTALVIVTLWLMLSMML